MEKFKALLNEMFTPLQIKLLIFGLRNDIPVYIYGDPDTGKSVLQRTLFRAGFSNIREAGAYSQGPRYMPEYNKDTIYFETRNDGRNLGIKYYTFMCLNDKIRTFIMDEFDFKNGIVMAQSIRDIVNSLDICNQVRAMLLCKLDYRIGKFLPEDAQWMCDALGLTPNQVRKLFGLPEIDSSLGGDALFNAMNKGIITYAEYLTLFCNRLKLVVK